VPKQTTAASANDSRRVYSIVEAARELGVSRGTVFTLLDRGELGFVRILRRRVVPASAIEKFLAKNLIEKRAPIAKSRRTRRVA
jgi:excisionase family DNA binding protein